MRIFSSEKIKYKNEKRPWLNQNLNVFANTLYHGYAIRSIESYAKNFGRY